MSPTVREILKVDYVGAVFQNVGCLDTRRMIIPQGVHLKSAACRFKWLFERK